VNEAVIRGKGALVTHFGTADPEAHCVSGLPEYVYVVSAKADGARAIASSAAASDHRTPPPIAWTLQSDNVLVPPAVKNSTKRSAARTAPGDERQSKGPGVFRPRIKSGIKRAYQVF
jgi:hypothetical protein